MTLLSLSQTDCSDNPVFLFCIASYFHLHSCSSVQQTMGTAKAWGPSCSRRRPERLGLRPPGVSSLVKLLRADVAAAVWSRGPVTHCRYALHLNQWREFVSCHITGRLYGGKHYYGDLVNEMKAGFCLFSFIALLAVCIPGFVEV